MKLWKLIKIILSIFSGAIGIDVIYELITKSPFLVINANIWQLVALSISLLMLANIEKIKELTFKLGDTAELSFKLSDSESNSIIKYKQIENKREILFYYSKYIPVKIWDNDGIKKDAIDDVKTLLSKDIQANEGIINYLENITVLLNSFHIKVLNDYGANSNGTFIRFNENQVACIGKFKQGLNVHQPINVSFPVLFRNLPNVDVLNKTMFMSILNKSNSGFSIEINDPFSIEKEYSYIAHG
jgi:hypothetical protein